MKQIIGFVILVLYLVNETVSGSNSTTIPANQDLIIGKVDTRNQLPSKNFPTVDQENVKILDNETIRANLLSGNKDTLKIDKPIDTEVEDLLHHRTNPTTNAPKEFANVEATMNNDTGHLKSETEWIENGENTEDTKIFNRETVNAHSSPAVGASLVQGQLAAILAGVFLIISITAYVVLLSWRRYLEAKYGSRQMLVNEEEFIDPNDDMRHFSI